MPNGQNRFALGASYYPPFHTPEDWGRDIERMASAGLNVVRTSELIASWEWIEPSKGAFDFGWLDRALDLCQHHGLDVLLGTGAGSPPLWLLDEYPDVQIVSQDGVPYPTGAMWGWACIHHPGFRRESERYLRVLLERYAGHPALLGWQLHNEPGHPAIQRLAGVSELYCYCEHSAAGFRHWLKAKYGDLEALSQAWACTPTHHRYRDWAQVRPPRCAPTSWGSPGAWLDWRQFIDQSFADFLSWQNEVVKAYDRLHPTTINLVHLVDPDLGVARGIDPWRCAEVSDVFGFDLYPRDRFQAEPFYTSLQLDYAHSPAAHAGKPFWLPEIESGPIGEWVLGPTHATTARDIRRHGLEAIAHGAKMLLYQGYREWDPLPLHWGALVDLHGEPTERYHAAVRLNQVVLSHEDLFLNAQPARPQIGILVDQRNAIACHGMGAQWLLLQAIKGLYSAYWSQGYGLEFITPELLARGKGQGYRLLLLPFLMLVTPEAAEAVTAFVAQGGTAVAFAKCGMLNERSWYWHDRPGGLVNLFGACETWIEKSESVSLVPDPSAPAFAGVQSPLWGYWHRQDFALQEGTNVLARYQAAGPGSGQPAGAPAAISRNHGKGRAILFGTHLDAVALGPETDDHRRVFANLAELAGVERPFVLDGAPLLDGHMLECGDRPAEQRLFVLVNHGPATASARVRLCSGTRTARVIDLFASRKLECHPEPAGLSFELELEGYDSTALLIEPTPGEA